MHPHLDFLLSVLYDRDPFLAYHLADLRASALTDATIAQQKFRTVPPSMIDALLGFSTPRVVSAYLLPFVNPRGGWLDHIRLKIFPPLKDDAGHSVKYLQPRRSGVRVYFPRASLDAIMHSDEPLWICEGEKKSLSIAQLALPAIGICGVEGWHRAESQDLLPDFDCVRLHGRTVKLVPDADVRTNPAVARAMHRLAGALERRGARAQLIMLPVEVSA